MSDDVDHTAPTRAAFGRRLDRDDAYVRANGAEIDLPTRARGRKAIAAIKAAKRGRPVVTRRSGSTS